MSDIYEPDIQVAGNLEFTPGVLRSNQPVEAVLLPDGTQIPADSGSLRLSGSHGLRAAGNLEFTLSGGVTTGQFGRLLDYLKLPPEAQAFFLGALAGPGDAGLFAVLADWLDEQDRRGEAARVRARAEKLRDSAPGA